MANRNKRVKFAEYEDMYDYVPDEDYYDEYDHWDGRDVRPATRPINIGRDRMWEAFMKAQIL
jgi:hypothetical protein